MENRQKELAKTTAIITFGKVCTQFINYFMLPLYTAILDPKEFGIFDLLNTYVALLLPIVNLHYDLGLFRFMLDYRENDEKQKKLFSSVMTANMVQCIVYLLFFACVQPLVHSEYKLYLAISVVFNVVLSSLLQFSRGLGHNRVYTMASFLSATGTVILNVIFIAVIRMGATGLFLAALAGQFFTIIYLIFSEKVWRYFEIRHFNREILRDVRRYSLPLVPADMSWWVVNVSDRTIISYILGVAANGIYSVANKFSSLVNTFYSVFNMAWTEAVSLHIDDEDRNAFLTESINTMFNLFVAMCFMIITLMPFIFPIMINAKYEQAYSQIPILMIAVMFQVICGLYSVIYLAKKKTYECAKTAFLAALINIVVNVLLIRKIGLYAASISTLVAYASMAVYRYFHSKRYVNAKLYGWNLMSALIVCVLIVSAYYYNHGWTNLLALAMTSAYVVERNWKTFQSMLGMLIKKLR